MERRDFIKFSGLSFLSLYSKDFFINKAFSEEKKNNYLILIELKGGNDGLNTVIPYSNETYYKLRPEISIPRDNLIKISENLALNPSMQELYKIWEKKELAIITGVGYPNPNRSHFRSIEIWETASDSNKILNDGWISRVFQKIKDKNKIDGLILGGKDFGALSGKNMKNLIIENTDQFMKQAGKIKKISQKTSNKSLAHILKVENEVYSSYEILDEYLEYVPEVKTVFPKTNIGNQALTAFKMISAKLPVSIIKLELGSFDTHINQRGNQDRLLKELSDAIEILKKSLVELNMWNNTTIMTYSEFGRRVAQNGSRGTDHGTASVHFVLGGKIKGGIYGTYPSLDDLIQGDLKYNIDYRSIYSSISKNLWNVSPDFLVKYPTIDFFL